MNPGFKLELSTQFRHLVSLSMRIVITIVFIMASPFTLPNGFQLLIATRGVVLSCCPSGISPIFQCASGDGILSAKAAQNGSGLLAIADSHVVILHDFRRRRDREYRLKGADVRSLKYKKDNSVH